MGCDGGVANYNNSNYTRLHHHSHALSRSLRAIQSTHSHFLLKIPIEEIARLYSPNLLSLTRCTSKKEFVEIFHPSSGSPPPPSIMESNGHDAGPHPHAVQGGNAFYGQPPTRVKYYMELNSRVWCGVLSHWGHSCHMYNIGPWMGADKYEMSDVAVRKGEVKDVVTTHPQSHSHWSRISPIACGWLSCIPLPGVSSPLLSSLMFLFGHWQIGSWWLPFLSMSITIYTSQTSTKSI